MKLLKYILILIILFLLGCTNFEGKKYISFENDVIKEIIPELLTLEHFAIRDIENVSVFIVNELDNKIEVVGFVEDEYNILPDEKLFFSRSEKEQMYNDEIKLFKPFLKGKIKSRNLNAEINYTHLNVKQISLERFENRKTSDFYNKINPGKVTKAYLKLTRIAFNRSRDLGYLNFTIFCGEGCFWKYNIEIKKVNEKWKVSRLFSGSIA